MRLLWLRPSTGDNISVRRERIAEHLRKHGVEVDIRDSSGFDAFPAALQALTGDYDVIAGNVRIGLYIGYPIARLLRKPFLGDVSDPLSDIESLPQFVFRVLEWYEWSVLKRTDATIFVYESSFREAKARGIDAVKLPNAVDYEKFADPDVAVVSETQEILETDGVDLQKPMAVYIGGFSREYHVTDILRAAREASDWEFVFVGEGPLEQEVVAAAAALQNVHFPGAFEYRMMPGFLAHADAGFCFKDAEQPLKLKEYGAAGIPAIVQSGELERWYDDDELIFTEPTAEAIACLLTGISTEALIEFGEKLQNATNDFTWRQVAGEYLEILKKEVSDS